MIITSHSTLISRLHILGELTVELSGGETREYKFKSRGEVLIKDGGVWYGEPVELAFHTRILRRITTVNAEPAKYKTAWELYTMAC